MARTTVDIAPVSPLARGIGQQGFNSVQFKANPNAGSSAGLLADALGVASDFSQRRDQRKIEEANVKFKTEFDGYVSKALQGDNVTGIDELDTLYPDMNMSRKLLILEAAGKKAAERDENFQSLLSSIGSQNTDANGVTTGFPNTLQGIQDGYASAETYLRNTNQGGNAAYISGQLGFLEAQRSAQIQQFVSGQRAAQLQDTKNDFETTDIAIAKSGDWEALLARDKTWKAAGANNFIQGKDRNTYVTNAAYEQAKDNRDITVLSTMPEEYKGSMKNKPQLWQTYLANVQREIDKMNADDVTARLKAKDDAKKLEQDDLLQKMINNQTLTEKEIRKVEANSSLSGSRDRLRNNTGVDLNVSKTNTTSLVGQLKNARTVEDLQVLKLTEEQLNDPKKLQFWASTQTDIHPQDVPTVLAAAQEAYYINDVRNSEEQKRFNSQIDDVLSDIRDIPLLDPMLGQAGMLSQDTSFFRRGKEIAEEEFEDLVAIYREENGNEKLTRRQLREIRELVVAKTQNYVTTFKGKSVAEAAYGLEGQITDLRNTSNQYRDPDTGVIYDVVSPEDAADIVANNSSAQFRQITSNRLIQIQ